MCPAKGWHQSDQLTGRIQCRIGEDVEKALDDIAEQNGTTRAIEVRRALDNYIMKGSLEERVKRLERMVFNGN